MGVALSTVTAVSCPGEVVENAADWTLLGSLVVETVTRWLVPTVVVLVMPRKRTSTLRPPGMRRRGVEVAHDGESARAVAVADVLAGRHVDHRGVADHAGEGRAGREGDGELAVGGAGERAAGREREADGVVRARAGGAAWAWRCRR